MSIYSLKIKRCVGYCNVQNSYICKNIAVSKLRNLTMCSSSEDEEKYSFDEIEVGTSPFMGKSSYDEIDIERQATRAYDALASRFKGIFIIPGDRAIRLLDRIVYYLRGLMDKVDIIFYDIDNSLVIVIRLKQELTKEQTGACDEIVTCFGIVFGLGQLKEDGPKKHEVALLYSRGLVDVFKDINVVACIGFISLDD